MVEIFKDIPQSVKDRAEFIFDITIGSKYIPDVVKVLNDYTNSCVNEEEKEFVQFYFNLRLQELLNGNISNKR